MERVIVNNKTYEKVKLLGKGKGGYSYLVVSDGKEYVLKQIHHEPCDYYEFGDKLASELRDYEILSKMPLMIPKLLDVDKEKEIIIKEYIEGKTVMEVAKENSLDDIFIEKMKLISSGLQKEGINIDYYPTNFIIRNDDIYYIDYECNEFMEKWSFENWGINYWRK
ncbi:MAG: hypothetical protein ACRCWM_11835 [Sarcina sp.]